MTVKLSNAMHEHLMAVDDEPYRSAYPRLSLATLNALERRGFVTSKRKLGSMAMPHTSIMWRITPAGRTALIEAARTALKEKNNG